MKRQYILTFCFACLFPLQTMAASTLIFANAWIAEAPPGVKVMAGYFDVVNTGSEEVLITEITSPEFGNIEFHRTVHEDGMMKMAAQPHVHVPPGKQVKLEPNGKHMMMFNPVYRFFHGDHVTLRISLSDGSKQTIKATVKAR
ncbi:MAG: copper chaperone PCu(A)C [Gammaproteobacteria bacterium]|nr:copper chaperone PCu(A)C [Gammaproteobacteria bacterium]MDH5651067.1 copper chaperone PCu(A)C [Gammaproteobacteria bacterium]